MIVLNLQVTEAGVRAQHIFSTLMDGAPEMKRYDFAPFSHHGDDVEEAREVFIHRLASIDPEWHQVVQIM